MEYLTRQNIEEQLVEGKIAVTNEGDRLTLDNTRSKNVRYESNGMLYGIDMFDYGRYLKSNTVFITHFELN